MQRNWIEAIFGVFVLVIAGLFLQYALTAKNGSNADSYGIQAGFSDVSGISLGTDVRLNGVKIGSVSKIELNPTNYRAEIDFTVRNDIKLASDSIAKIASSGLLGDKYVAIIPGVEDDTLENGGKITQTETSLSLEDMLGKFIFSASTPKSDPADPDHTDENAQP